MENITEPHVKVETESSTCRCVCACCTHSLSVDWVHSKEECCDKGQTGVFKNAAFTCVHEEAAYSRVQKHIYNVEVERFHAVQKYIQPDREKKTERKRERKKEGKKMSLVIP